MGGFFVVKGENMKTVGIIGGLGPETTARFYMEVVFACSKISGKRPQILISSVGIPLKIEKEIITEAKNEKNILPFLIDTTRQLERAGADFIVIPCNTAHIFIKEIRKAVKIPVLSIVEETSIFLRKEKIKEVGLLATAATIKNKLFDENLKRRGIKIKTPDDSNQSKIGVVINRLINNLHNERDKKEILEIINELRVRNVVLACTDLQILNIKCNGVKIFDSMDILAKATIKEQLQ